MKFDRLDYAVIIVISALLLMTGFVLVRGDQIGIGVSAYSPQNSASSRPIVRITFDEPLAIQTGALENFLSISPQVAGKITESTNQITFQPLAALPQGQDYTVTLQAGIAGKSGRQLKQAIQWHFRVAPPRVVYLGPVDSITPNLYLIDPATPNAAPQKLTDIKEGVRSYAISPDGSSIVYEAILPPASSLYLWDAATNTSSVLYDCPDAVCSNPVWRPDGGAIAFEHADLNTKSQLGPSVPRIWVLDMATKAATPLFTDKQKLGLTPRWSPDGTKIAVYDSDSNGIVIHTVSDGSEQIIPIEEGQIGDFSPDGKWMYFPKVILLNPQQYVSHEVLVDLTNKTFVQRDLIPDSDPGDDIEAVWRADSSGMIVARQQPGTANALPTPAQVYSIDLATRKATPLVNDLGYGNSNLAVSPDGGMLLIQRQPMDTPGARPELWLYNLKTNELKMIAKNGAVPRWIP